MTRKNSIKQETKPRNPIDHVLSTMFYNRALDWSRPFTVVDIVGEDANAERKTSCKSWLGELVERGELKKTKTRRNIFYEWIN